MNWRRDIDPLPYIKTIEEFGNQGGMISEQLWDADDLPNGQHEKGLADRSGHAVVLVARRIYFVGAKPA